MPKIIIDLTSEKKMCKGRIYLARENALHQQQSSQVLCIYCCIYNHESFFDKYNQLKHVPIDGLPV